MHVNPTRLGVTKGVSAFKRGFWRLFVHRKLLKLNSLYNVTIGKFFDELWRWMGGNYKRNWTVRISNRPERFIT